MNFPSIDGSNEFDGRALPAWQFRLRTLLLLVATCSTLFAAMAWLGMFWSLVILFFALMIGAHVAGNAIGTRLRNQSMPRPMVRISPPELPTETRVVPDGPPPHLRHGSAVGLKTVVFTLAGTISGALLGRMLFAQIDRGQMSAAKWSLAVGSFALIAGLVGFLVSRFFQLGFWPAAKGYFHRSGSDHDTDRVTKP